MTDFLKDVVLGCGGSLSHHHGVGHKNTARYNAIMSPLKKKMLKTLKDKLDPKNIFCVQNFFENSIDKPKVEAKL